MIIILLFCYVISPPTRRLSNSDQLTRESVEEENSICLSVCLGVLVRNVKFFFFFLSIVSFIFMLTLLLCLYIYVEPIIHPPRWKFTSQYPLVSSVSFSFLSSSVVQYSTLCTYGTVLYTCTVLYIRYTHTYKTI